ncbi:MFS transporter [Saccharopolyspora griseoalba]|uniref:MFS transporter n=1 Tax=Saccharopolyspora griseoalba TaxID=1431848 RepID=A0ABW2LIQ5_9PSEU
MRSRWLIVAVAALVIVSAGACATIAGLLVAPLHREFGWSHATISAAAALNLVLYGLTAPFAAAATDRFGVRGVVAAALLLIAAGAGLTSSMCHAWQFAVGWGLLVGTGTGALTTPFAAAVAERWFAARRGLVTGMLTAASVFGQFALLPVLSRLVVDVQWRAATATLAALALAALPAAWAVLRDRPAAGPTRPAPAPASIARAAGVLRDAARRPRFWLLTSTFAVCGATTNGLMWTHFTPAAHEHGMPVSAAASLLALVGVVNIAGTVGSGWLTDRVRPHLLLASYYLLRGLSLLALPQLLGPEVRPGVIAFAVVFGLLDVATVPPTMALCRRAWGADGAIAFGWISTGHQLGAGGLAWVGGALRELTGDYAALWPTAAVLCGAAAGTAVLLRSGSLTRTGGRTPSSAAQVD